MKITIEEIITRTSKLEDLKEALNKIGVLGMTVSQVYGCGLQKGHKEIYRGQEYEVNLVPKIKVETVLFDIHVARGRDDPEQLRQPRKDRRGTHFVYELSDAVRIRTGDRGEDAIKDEK